MKIDDLIQYRKPVHLQAQDSKNYLAATVRLMDPTNTKKWMSFHIGDFRKEGESDSDFKARLKEALLESLKHA